VGAGLARLSDPRSAPPSGTRRRLLGRRLGDLFDPLSLVGLAALVVVWLLLSPELGPLRLPSISATWHGIVDHFFNSPIIAAQGGGSSGLWPHLLATTARTLAGVTIGGLIGVSIGLVAANSNRFRWLVTPPLDMLRVTPSLVAAPFLILWFGVSDVAQIGLVAFYTLLVLQVNTLTAIANLPPQYASFASTLGASRRRILRTVTVPGIIPELIGGLRVALQLAWGLAIVSELIGAQRGIGRMMESVRQLFRFDLIFAAIVLIAVVAVLIDLLMKLALYRATRWQEGIGESAAGAK
jgi:ABC-type nitrate/sulfonate/bicarbonate transport system permease component